jgi:hypothetical protein
MSSGDDLARVAAILGENADVVAGRVGEARAPRWCTTRGWDGFLFGLDEEVVAACESFGVAATLGEVAGVPYDLAELAERVRAVTALPRAVVPDRHRVDPGWRVPGRKRAQVSALLATAPTLQPEAGRGEAPAGRAVDFGAGHGHLTRGLRRDLGLDAIGVERDGERLRTARTLAAKDGPRFVQHVVDGKSSLLRRGDLAVGLHACGALGDDVVRQAREAGSDVLLVGCCPQKIPGELRPPLSRRGDALRLALRRETLGLANLGGSGWLDGEARAHQLRRGARGSVDDVMRGRETRHALRLFLAGRGIEEPVGRESRGMNRMRFRRELATVAETACAVRGLAPPRADEIAGAALRARRELGALRRFSLPRNMLARVLELAVALDRACALEESGHAVRVLEAFSPSVSPRNIAVLSRAPR